MSLYNSNQIKLEHPNQKPTDLKVRTSLLQQQQQQQQSPTVVFNQYYPSPHSPLSTSASEQALSQSLLQEQQQQQDEWIMMQNQFDELQQQQQQHQHQMHHYQHHETTFSEASSLGIRTPDIGLSDIMSTTTSTTTSQQQQQQLFGYTSFLHHRSSSLDVSFQPQQQNSLLHHQCHNDTNHYLPTDDWIVQEHVQLIPSLSHQDHMMLLQKGYSEEAARFLVNQPQQYDFAHHDDTLTQLSREQLIERVVQLEMEKSNRSITIQHEPAPLNYEPTLCNQKIKKPTNQQQLIPTTATKQQPQPQDEPENKMYSCLWVSCTAQAPSLDKLMTHICESHIGSGKATYFCEWEDCPRNKKPFMKRHKMHNHMRTHTGERPFVCTVIGCNKTFSRPDSLSTHIKTHSDIRPYLCSMPGCEKAYFHSRSLRKHIKSSHMKKPTTSSSVRRNTPSSVQQTRKQTSNNMMSAGSRSNTLLSTIKLDHPYNKKQIIIPSNHSLHHQFYSM